MCVDTSRAAEPSADDFIGESPSRVAKRLFHATRPKFFPASALPVVVGTAWGSAMGGRLDLMVFILALVATVCVHAAANVLNDVGDETSGTDRRNEQRIYPYTGGSRFIQVGIMTTVQMTRWGITLLGLASVAGALLLWIKGPIILVFGLIGVLLAVLYSLGPARLNSLGIGEAVVGFAFGVLPVCGAAWLQNDVVDVNVLVFSLPVSVWVAAILLINEVPDIEADAASGKRTLPVRIGRSGTAQVYLGMQVAAALAVGWLSVVGPLPLLAAAVPLLLLPLAVKASGGIARGAEDRDRLTASIEATLGIHALGSIWLTLVMLYVAFASSA